MPLKIKADEDLPGSVAVKLRGAGYRVDTVVEEGIGGTKDPALWQAVQAEGQFLITADKGFADVRKYPPGTHQGVMLLRPMDLQFRNRAIRNSQLNLCAPLQTTQAMPASCR